MPLESTIQKAIMKWLKTVPDCYAIVYTAQARGHRGQPDILGCYMGKMFLIEVKQPGEVSDILQQSVQQKWRKAGACVGEADSVAAAKQLLSPILATSHTGFRAAE